MTTPNAAPKLDPATRLDVRSFVRGELTWAQVEGMTYEEAQQIARVGCELAGNGKLEESRVIFEGLVELNPKDTSAQAALGTVYQRLGRSEEALGCFERAVELFEGNVVALAGRGELRLRAGDARGLQDLARTAELDPSCTFAATRRARAILEILVARDAQRSKPPANVRPL